MYLNAVLAGIVFMVVFEPLKSEAEKRIHQFFFRERYDLETSVSELRRRLSHALEVDETVKTLLEGLERSRRITSCAVYLRDADGNGFDLAGSAGQPVPARIESLAARPLLERLGHHASLSLDSLAREPSLADGPILTVVHALGLRGSSLLLPLRAEEDQVVGILSIADDRVKDAYAPEEIGMLETVAAQVGVTLTNSRLYSRMKERDRLAALGALAAGLAHEIKNPLGAIKGAAQLLEELDGAPPPSHETTRETSYAGTLDPSSAEFIGIILEEVNRLDRVVGSFLDYARPHAGNPVPLDINAAVRRTVQILTAAGAQSNGEVDVRLELADELPRASIDPEQFRQVLINLVQNAIQAVEGSGHVTVTTGARRSGRVSWPGAPVSDRRSTRRVGGISGDGRGAERERRRITWRSRSRTPDRASRRRSCATCSSPSSPPRSEAPVSVSPSARASCNKPAAPSRCSRSRAPAASSPSCSRARRRRDWKPRREGGRMNALDIVRGLSRRPPEGRAGVGGARTSGGAGRGGLVFAGIK